MYDRLPAFTLPNIPRFQLPSIVATVGQRLPQWPQCRRATGQVNGVQPLQAQTRLLHAGARASHHLGQGLRQRQRQALRREGGVQAGVDPVERHGCIRVGQRRCDLGLLDRVGQAMPQALLQHTHQPPVQAQAAE